jgi:uncharacterized protein (TIGR02246 family)
MFGPEVIVKHMRHMVVIALSLAGSRVLAEPPRESTIPAEDEAAIRASANQLVRGWNTKDAELFARPFAPDADYVAINGLQVRGRKAIAQGHRRIFATLYKDSTIALSIKHIRMIGRTQAVVHLAGTNRTRQGAEVRQINMVLSMVMTKAAAWQIVSFQNTEIEPSAARAPRGGT